MPKTRGAPWRRNYARSKRFASFFAGFSDERTMELTSHVGTGLSDRTVPDLVSLILYICDTCVYRENTKTIEPAHTRRSTSLRCRKLRARRSGSSSRLLSMLI